MRQRAAQGSFRVCCPLRVRMPNSGPSSGTRRSSGPADWAGFLADQCATALQRQREVKLPDRWLSQIEVFLASVPTAPGREPVLLHTEVIREHLLVDPLRGR